VAVWEGLARHACGRAVDDCLKYEMSRGFWHTTHSTHPVVVYDLSDNSNLACTWAGLEKDHC
jgi:hypothetical protein